MRNGQHTTPSNEGLDNTWMDYVVGEEGRYPSGLRKRDWSSSSDASISRDGDDNACPISGPMHHARVVPSSYIRKHNRTTFPFVGKTQHGIKFKRLLVLFYFMGISRYHLS